jgi:hypothetical protein
MPVTASQIRWGQYSVYEGPYFPGVTQYQMPESPDFEDKLLRTVTATEGGAYDAINMYDSCILSVGIIQLCEKLFKVSDMLGECAMEELSFIKTMLAQLPYPADFKKNPRNQWRLMFLDGRGDVDSPDKMRLMYLGGASGQKGGYTDAQKAHAKEVAVVFASLWDNPGMRQAQVNHLKPRMASYVMSRAKGILAQNQDKDGLSGALKAAVVSYAANIPTVADKCLWEASQLPAWASASDADKFTLAMKSMVFSSQVAIWPGRYKKIQPVLENLFGVDLPTLEDLAGPNDSPHTANGNFNTPQSIQQFLIDHGYDLGPAGADGMVGPKTREAIVSFQCSKNLYPDGVVGPETRSAMLSVLQSEGK